MVLNLAHCPHFVVDVRLDWNAIDRLSMGSAETLRVKEFDTAELLDSLSPS